MGHVRSRAVAELGSVRDQVDRAARRRRSPPSAPDRRCTGCTSATSLAKGCARLRIKPAMVTFAGLLACLLVPVFVGSGHGTGGRLLAAGAGRVRRGRPTPSTARSPSSRRTPRSSDTSTTRSSTGSANSAGCWRCGGSAYPAYLALIAGAMSWLHEYTRARANAAGMTRDRRGRRSANARPGSCSRSSASRSPAWSAWAATDLPTGVATFVVAVWVVLAVIGFMQLFASIHARWPAGIGRCGSRRRRSRRLRRPRRRPVPTTSSPDFRRCRRPPRSTHPNPPNPPPQNRIPTPTPARTPTFQLILELVTRHAVEASTNSRINLVLGCSRVVNQP